MANWSGTRRWAGRVAGAFALCSACDQGSFTTLLPGPSGEGEQADAGGGASVGSGGTSEGGSSGSWLDPDAAVVGGAGGAAGDAGTPPADGFLGPPRATPVQIKSDLDGVVYLLSPVEHRIFRWDTSSNGYLESLPLRSSALTGDVKATSIAVISYERVYIGYDNGEVWYVDLSFPLAGEVYVDTLPGPVRALTAIGSRLLAVDELPALTKHHLYDEWGDELASSVWPLTAGAMAPELFAGAAYDPVRQRYFFFCDDQQTRDLCAEEVDEAGATLGDRVDAEDYRIVDAPIRVSGDGSQLVLGSGAIYDAALQLKVPFHNDVSYYDLIDAQWLPDGGLISIHRESLCCGKPQFYVVGTQLERRTSRGVQVEQMHYRGAPLAILPAAQGFVVVTTTISMDEAAPGIGGSGGDDIGPADDGGPHFYTYQPNDDSDGDGTPNDVDAFAVDATVALDRDRDGAPDAYNAGYSADNSTQIIDAYPDNPACQLPEQGDGQTCDTVAATHWGPPEQLAIDEHGVVYLLDYYRSIDRWDSQAQAWLPPIYLPHARFPNDRHVTVSMAYSLTNQRLYLGEFDGAITAVDVQTEPPTLSDFAHLGPYVSNLAAAGSFLLAVDEHDQNQQYVIDASGTRVAKEALHQSSPARGYVYDAALQRIYRVFGRTLSYTQLNPATGAIVSTAEVVEPESALNSLLRISSDGRRLLWDNQLYDAESLALQGGKLDGRWSDALLLDDGGMITLTASTNATTLERFAPDGAVAEQVEYGGQPFGVLPFEDHFIVVTQVQTVPYPAPVFETYVPGSN